PCRSTLMLDRSARGARGRRGLDKLGAGHVGRLHHRDFVWLDGGARHLSALLGIGSDVDRRDIRRGGAGGRLSGGGIGRGDRIGLVHALAGGKPAGGVARRSVGGGGRGENRGQRDG